MGLLFFPICLVSFVRKYFGVLPCVHINDTMVAKKCIYGKKGNGMQIYIGVKDFGKIESAEINISSFTIFVGNNNSGKTYLMQLIYGVIDELVNQSSFWMDEFFSEDKTANETILDKNFIEKLVSQINVMLDNTKDKLVKKIFHNPIPLGLLYLKVTDIQETYKILCEKNVPITVTNHVSDEGVVRTWNRFSLLKQSGSSEYSRVRAVFSERLIIDKEMGRHFTGEIVADMFGFRNRMLAKKQMVYLPASRTGLLLLYRYFFANQHDVYLQDSPDMFAVEEDETENRIQVPSPVYDFLQFLLTYEPTQKRIEENMELISFVEKHLLDGKLIEMGDITYYEPSANEAQSIPLYLASSMVNEIAPLNKILTGFDKVKYLMYDEIETCMHPTKQVEMARLLNRLNNAGMKLLVSTHSDTMATRINNLLLLSKLEVPAEKKQTLLSKLGLEKADIVQSSEVHIYQFANDKEGKSHVSELEFTNVPFTGYDFKQFNDNAMDLYEEAKVILGLE